MLSFIPHSVSRCRAGFVRNPAAGWSLNVPQWIPAPKARVPVDMARVDRVVNTLSRFVATWVVQSRAARRREAGEKWMRAAMMPNWASIMEREEIRQRIFARGEIDRYASLSEPEWRTVARALIADAIAAGRDLLPVARTILAPVWAERDARKARLAEQERMWTEMSRANLHNQQRSAPVRVARVVARSGRYAALGDSDSE